MITPDDNSTDGKPTIINDFRQGNKLGNFLRNLLVFILLVGVIAASFWVSFILGKKILMPVRKPPRQKIEVAIPEPPPAIAGLQKLEEVPKGAVIESKTVPAPVKEIVKKKIYAGVAKHYYKVQAGVFKYKNNALNLAKKLKTKGFDTYLKRVSMGWRVQVGAYRDKAQAMDLKSTLRSNGFNSVVIYE